MNDGSHQVFAVAFFLLIVLVSGCIEGSFDKTETIIAKTDGTGTILSSVVIANDGYATARSGFPSPAQIIQTKDEGFFIAGFFFNNTGHRDLRLFQTDRTGNPVWDKRIHDQNGELLSVLQRDDGGYSLFWRDGRISGYNASGSGEKTISISDMLNWTTSPSGFCLRSIYLTPDRKVTAIITGGDYYAYKNPVIVAGLFDNGTIISEKTYSLASTDGTRYLAYTTGGGFLQAKTLNRDEPGGGQRILLEKTNEEGSRIWSSTLGICNYTFCNNDLLDLHESEDRGYVVIYKSVEQKNASSSSPSRIVSATLDTNGTILHQEIVTDLPELPPWFLASGRDALEIANLINQNARNSLVSDSRKQAVRISAIVKTRDGGYALLGTRYYGY